MFPPTWRAPIIGRQKPWPPENRWPRYNHGPPRQCPHHQTCKSRPQSALLITPQASTENWKAIRLDCASEPARGCLGLWGLMGYAFQSRKRMHTLFLESRTWPQLPSLRHSCDRMQRGGGSEVDRWTRHVYMPPQRAGMAHGHVSRVPGVEAKTELTCANSLLLPRHQRVSPPYERNSALPLDAAPRAAGSEN